MDGRVDLLTWGSAPAWSLGEVHVLPERIDRAAALVQGLLARHEAPWLLFWDPLLGPPPAEVVAGLAASGDADAWHGGASLGTAGLPAEHDYVHPTTPLNVDPDPSVGGTSWRLALGAALVRADALAAVGGLDGGFGATTGAGLDLGRRLIEQGAVVRHVPELVDAVGGRVPELTEADRFLFLRRTFGAKWVTYAALRRALATRRPLRTWRGYRASGRVAARHPAPARGLVEREPVAVDRDARISVVLPTLGRYELLRPLLAQLADQTIRPVEILVVDQNDPDRRDLDLYREAEAWGVRPIFQDVRGQWISRNAAVQQSLGDWIAFIDDDSEIEPDFLEAHLEGLARYHADLSTGASLAVVGAPVPDNYRFFRVADQWDSGNGMCHRRLFVQAGLFDQRYDRQRRGDAEFGLRVQRGGGLVIHNPRATRVHLKAAEGGLRTFGQWDGLRSKERTGPLPVPSMRYYTATYHTPRQQHEDLMLGLVNGVVPYHLKRRASPAAWLRFAAGELVHLPSLLRRVRASRRIAEEMIAAGPDIPQLER